MEDSPNKGSFRADIPTDAVEEALRSVERVTAHGADPGEATVEVEAGAEAPAEGGGDVQGLQAQLELSQALAREGQKKLEDVHDR